MSYTLTYIFSILLGIPSLPKLPGQHQYFLNSLMQFCQNFCLEKCHLLWETPNIFLKIMPLGPGYPILVALTGSLYNNVQIYPFFHNLFDTRTLNPFLKRPGRYFTFEGRSEKVKYLPFLEGILWVRVPKRL